MTTAATQHSAWTGAGYWRRGSVVASVSLTLGFVDALMAMMLAPSGFESFVSFLYSLSLLSALAAVCMVALLTLSRVVFRRAWRDREGALVLAVACFAVFSYVAIFAAGLNDLLGGAGEARGWAGRAVLLLAVSALAGLGIYHALASAASGTARSVQRVILLFAPLALGTATVLLVLRHTAFSDKGWSAPMLIAVAATLTLGSAAVILCCRGARSEGSALMLLLALVLAGPVAGLGRGERLPAPRPDASRLDRAVARIILITVDALRRDALGAFNSQSGLTPRLDEFAKDCILFENAFTPSPWTVPSFVSMLTGTFASEHGVNEYTAPLPDGSRSIAEYLRDAGYATAAVGHQPQLLRMGKGFDHFDFWPRRLPFNGHTTGGKLLWRLFLHAMSTPELTDRAIAWTNSHAAQEFFLWIHYLDPHGPWTPPERLLTDDPMRDSMGTAFLETTSAVRAGRAVRSLEERRWVRALYDAEVRYVDENIGRFMDALRQADLYDDSLIIVTNDHGEEFWDHDGFAHGHTLYNELVTAPLLVKLPGASKAGSASQVVTTCALLPTVLDLCGIAYSPDAFSAPSFAPLLTGSGPYEERPVRIGATEYFAPREAVVFDNLKLILQKKDGLTWLFDLSSDPTESESVAELRPEAVQKGRELLNESTEPLAPPTNQQPPPEPKDDFIQDQLQAIGYL